MWALIEELKRLRDFVRLEVLGAPMHRIPRSERAAHRALPTCPCEPRKVAAYDGADVFIHRRAN